MRSLIIVVCVLTCGACSKLEVLGTAGVCYAASDIADEAFPLELDDVRSGLVLVPAGEETEAPASFVSCARGMPAQVEMIDDDGAHVWLAVEAHHGARELVRQEHLRLVNGADLRVRLVGGFVPSSALVLAHGDQPVVALQAGGALDGDAGRLRVEDAGANGVPTPSSCGAQTTHALRFVDDDGAKDSNAGDSVQIIVGGVEFLGTNIHTVDLGQPQCTDTASGVVTTWVAADNSI